MPSTTILVVNPGDAGTRCRRNTPGWSEAKPRQETLRLLRQGNRILIRDRGFRAQNEGRTDPNDTARTRPIRVSGPPSGFQ